MSAITKKKLCWNCEGRVAQEVENCSYCGVYLNGTVHLNGQGHGIDDEDDIEESTPVVHKPLYTPEADVQIKNDSPKISSKNLADNSEKSERDGVSSKVQQEFVPLILLTIGSVLFLFGLVLSIFSRNDVMVLQWNGSLWFLYILFGLPALIAGWKMLSQIKS